MKAIDSDWIVETNYTDEDIARARTYMYTVCLMIDRVLHVVDGIATRTRLSHIVQCIAQCRTHLDACISMASNNHTHHMSAVGRATCTYYERQFVELSQQHILSHSSVSNVCRLSYLIKNLRWFIDDVITYVPAAYHGDAWRDLSAALTHLELAVYPDTSLLSTVDEWTHLVFDTLRYPIMLLPPETYPCPVEELS